MKNNVDKHVYRAAIGSFVMMAVATLFMVFASGCSQIASNPNKTEVAIVKTLDQIGEDSNYYTLIGRISPESNLKIQESIDYALELKLNGLEFIPNYRCDEAQTRAECIRQIARETRLAVPERDQ